MKRPIPIGKSPIMYDCGAFELWGYDGLVIFNTTITREIDEKLAKELARAARCYGIKIYLKKQQVMIVPQDTADDILNCLRGKIAYCKTCQGTGQIYEEDQKNGILPHSVSCPECNIAGGCAQD